MLSVERKEGRREEAEKVNRKQKLGESYSAQKVSNDSALKLFWLRNDLRTLFTVGFPVYN